jgi:hypothetical protein
VDRLQLTEGLVAELLDRRRAGLEENFERSVLLVPFEVLTVKIDHDPDRVLLVRRVGRVDLHQLLEPGERGEVRLPVRGVVRPVGQAVTLPLVVREVRLLAREVPDRRLPFQGSASERGDEVTEVILGRSD